MECPIARTDYNSTRCSYTRDTSHYRIVFKAADTSVPHDSYHSNMQTHRAKNVTKLKNWSRVLNT